MKEEPATIDVSSPLPPMADGYYNLNSDGVTIPVSYKAGKNNTMIILFHGAVDRSAHTLPRFQGPIPGMGGRHQLSISDPTLALDDSLSLGWFSGGRDAPVQSAITKAIARVSRHVRAGRRVYVGGSAGGFAALYYSWRDPGSICIAVNPQIALDSYYPNPARNYLEKAWPGARSFSDIAGKADLNLAECYSKRFDNLVIYMQSCGDAHHFSEHFSAFVDVGLKNSDKFILDSGYWGIPGHAMSVPTAAYHPWVRAAVVSPAITKDSILETYHTVTSSAPPAPAAAPKAAAQSAAGTAVSDADLRLARMLRDFHLAEARGA